MSYISLLLPAFHINTTDSNEVQKYCSSQFNISPEQFEVIEIMDNSSNINFAIKFLESNFSLKSIEELIYQRNCMQNLSEKMFESLKLMNSKFNEIITALNGKENKEQNKTDLMNDNIKLKELLASQIEYSDNFRMNTEMTLSKIKDEFRTMVKELETLKQNANDENTEIEYGNLSQQILNTNQNNISQKINFPSSVNNFNSQDNETAMQNKEKSV
jgi:hypothetical protein